MTWEDLLKSQIDIVSESDILGDVIYPDEPSRTLADLIKKKVEEAEDASDFLIVYVGLDKVPKAMLTLAEIGDRIDSLMKTQDSKFIKDLDLETIAPLNKEFLLKKTDTVADIIRILQSKETDVLLVVNDEGVYAGKIRRARFVEKIKTLLSSNSSILS